MTGIAQVGISGLTKVQYSLSPQEPEWPKDDPWFTRADWKDADVLPAPENWGGGLPEGRLPQGTIGIDAASWQTGDMAACAIRSSIGGP